MTNSLTKCLCSWEIGSWPTRLTDIGLSLVLGAMIPRGVRFGEGFDMLG